MFHKRRQQGSQKGRPRKRFKGAAGKMLPSDYSAGGGPRRPSSLRPFYGRSASNLIVRQPGVMPDRLYTKLRYREQLTFTQTTGSLSDQVYRPMSLFDPDLTGTGGQPYGFDQWTQFYGYYTVLASGITVEWQVGGCKSFFLISILDSGWCSCQQCDCWHCTYADLHCPRRCWARARHGGSILEALSHYYGCSERRPG